ncbi:hypothetical protein OG394_14185 [Kribbella sp. NBC_01245]|uniref:hypothetical protein n=1 Tax=Kribbella sp. NBC_01245 TaxID=2903578 RepID=UPI002E290161|nr:hypothetical protein [Kribbella sp. NBC_01245]
MTDKSDPSKDPLRWLWRGSLVLFATSILLNLAVSFLRPIMPWLIGGVILGIVLWVAVLIIRWRQSRW